MGTTVTSEVCLGGGGRRRAWRCTMNPAGEVRRRREFRVEGSNTPTGASGRSVRLRGALAFSTVQGRFFLPFDLGYAARSRNERFSTKTAGVGPHGGRTARSSDFKPTMIIAVIAMGMMQVATH